MHVHLTEMKSVSILCEFKMYLNLASNLNLIVRNLFTNVRLYFNVLKRNKSDSFLNLFTYKAI